VETQNLLLLQLQHEWYALPGSAVRAVTRWRAPTPVPGAPATIPGIISQRGVVLPVVDVRPLLGLPDGPPERSARYVITHHGDVELALYVDGIHDLTDVPAAELEPPPSALNPQRLRLLRAVTRVDERPVALFDMAALVAALRD
jgi:purine-binding chemotaxis protein CheW